MKKTLGIAWDFFEAKPLMVAFPEEFFPDLSGVRQLNSVSLYSGNST